MKGQTDLATNDAQKRLFDQAQGLELISHDGRRLNPLLQDHVSFGRRRLGDQPRDRNFSVLGNDRLPLQ